MASTFSPIYTVSAPPASATEQQNTSNRSMPFTQVKSVSLLPQSVIALCADGHGKIADIQQAWEVGNFISDAKLARNRLIWAAVSGDRYVVHYEQGGRGHSFHTLIAEIKKTSALAKVIQRSTSLRAENYAAFISSLENEHFESHPR